MEEPAHLSSALIPGGREGRPGAGPGLIPQPPQLLQPPGLGASFMSPTLYSSRVSPHPYHEEEAVEDWVWDAPGTRLSPSIMGRGGGKARGCRGGPSWERKNLKRLLGRGPEECTKEKQDLIKGSFWKEELERGPWVSVL